ncbi:16S rRNA (cytidine(1402)-2'-O)-methyltransferase [Acetobacteraceae bacterium KSS12]|uniref:Ribosomal RNA small subunit methyltransferase I n=1 Tax=Rhizosaccharibacter radicis TaxID=2782605 RepID=A0ABT1VSX5_9PROT|nr:16S rRNA (cytidine(1402)-2'-O)-methyltransferase [Acetobacteraceae bacterium KSS12]
MSFPGGSLTLVSTPIGNLGDITERALSCLRAADLVLCEDTRVTGRLFFAKSISVPLEALHEHNERQRTPALLRMLVAGKRIALVSDAGTPLLSDPGFRLVRDALEAGLPVTAAPGANAAVTALTLSGLPPHPFLFHGFSPPRQSARRDAFGKLRAAEQAGLSATLIWHEAPHRLAEMLADLRDVLGGDRPGAVARELTKRFEEVRRGTLAELAEHYEGTAARGEITVLAGPPVAEDPARTAAELDQRLMEAMRTLSVKDAATLVAGALSLPRKLVYNRALELGRGPEG